VLSSHFDFAGRRFCRRTVDAWFRAGGLTKKKQEARQLTEDQATNQLSSDGNVIVKKTPTRPQAFFHSSRYFQDQIESLLSNNNNEHQHQFSEVTSTMPAALGILPDLPGHKQSSDEYESQIPATPRSHTSSLTGRSSASLRTHNEPCHEIPRTEKRMNPTIAPIPLNFNPNLQKSLNNKQTSTAAKKETCRFLVCLPLELRIMIYEYVFRTTSGYVKYTQFQLDDGTTTPLQFDEYNEPRHAGKVLKRTPITQPMTSLLRACKEILKEGKPSFWKENGLAVIPHPELGNTIVPFASEKFLYHVPRVLLDFHNYEWSHALHTTAEIFQSLGSAVEKGRLKDVTLVGVPHERGAHNDMVWRPFVFPLSYWICHREEYNRMLQILRDSRRQLGNISTLERKILTKTDEFEAFFVRSVMHPRLKRRLEAVTKEISSAFGGELVINNEIVCKDGADIGPLKGLFWGVMDGNDNETGGDNQVELGINDENEEADHEDEETDADDIEADDELNFAYDSLFWWETANLGQSS
jgi:hypothetical protein